MARKRMISPDIWDSENFSKLSVLARLIFIGMFSNADDEGRGRAKASFLKSKLFPYDESMRVADVESALDEVAENMSVIIYSHDGNEYYSFDNWKKWQKVDKPSPSNIIPFGEGCNIIRGTFDEHSANTRGTFPPNRIEQNKNRKEDKTTEDNRPPSAVPQNIVDLYQENISRNYITSAELDNLEFWLTRVDADMLEWAIREAVDSNKRTWKYTEAILNNHFNAGRTTLASVLESQKYFKAQKDRAASVRGESGLSDDELERIMREKM